MVSLLLEYKASVAAQGHLGSTPLHGAAFHGHGDVVGLLLAAGAGASADLKDRVRNIVPLLLFDMPLLTQHMHINVKVRKNCSRSCFEKK